MEKLKAAIALKPSIPRYHNNLGITLARSGKFDEAAPILTGALVNTVGWPLAGLLVSTGAVEAGSGNSRFKVCFHCARMVTVIFCRSGEGVCCSGTTILKKPESLSLDRKSTASYSGPNIQRPRSKSG